MNMIMYFLALFPIFAWQSAAYPDNLAEHIRNTFNTYSSDNVLHAVFPHWGTILLILSGMFLAVAAAGLIGYLLGCRSPPPATHCSSTASTAPFLVIQNFTSVI
ncbi:hypothetical protein I4U23_014164 [Adineta vaga]|nr:hypothetical protein I4U23_014164 [Adineta vaga]